MSESSNYPAKPPPRSSSLSDLLIPQHHLDSNKPHHDPVSRVRSTTPTSSTNNIPNKLKPTTTASSTPGTNTSNTATGKTQTVFIHKLYDMLEDQSISHLIWWSPNNVSFFLYPGEQFSKVLAQYFKHTNIASFIRQLNMYGFHKVNDNLHNSDDIPSIPAGPGIDDKKDTTTITRWEFRHSTNQFRKGDLESLKLIKRRSSKNVNSHKEVININSIMPPMIPTSNPYVDDSMADDYFKQHHPHYQQNHQQLQQQQQYHHSIQLHQQEQAVAAANATTVTTAAPTTGNSTPSHPFQSHTPTDGISPHQYPRHPPPPPPSAPPPPPPSSAPSHGPAPPPPPPQQQQQSHHAYPVPSYAPPPRQLSYPSHSQHPPLQADYDTYTPQSRSNSHSSSHPGSGTPIAGVQTSPGVEHTSSSSQQQNFESSVSYKLFQLFNNYHQLKNDHFTLMTKYDLVTRELHRNQSDLLQFIDFFERYVVESNMKQRNDDPPPCDRSKENRTPVNQLRSRLDDVNTSPMSRPPPPTESNFSFDTDFINFKNHIVDRVKYLEQQNYQHQQQRRSQPGMVAPAVSLTHPSYVYPTTTPFQPHVAPPPQQHDQQSSYHLNEFESGSRHASSSSTTQANAANTNANTNTNSNINASSNATAANTNIVPQHYPLNPNYMVYNHHEVAFRNVKLNNNGDSGPTGNSGPPDTSNRHLSILMDPLQPMPIPQKNARSQSPDIDANAAATPSGSANPQQYPFPNMHHQHILNQQRQPLQPLQQQQQQQQQQQYRAYDSQQPRTNSLPNFDHRISEGHAVSAKNGIQRHSLTSIYSDGYSQRHQQPPSFPQSSSSSLSQTQSPRQSRHQPGTPTAALSLQKQVRSPRLSIKQEDGKDIPLPRSVPTQSTNNKNHPITPELSARSSSGSTVTTNTILAHKENAETNSEIDDESAVRPRNQLPSVSELDKSIKSKPGAPVFNLLNETENDGRSQNGTASPQRRLEGDDERDEESRLKKRKI